MSQFGHDPFDVLDNGIDGLRLNQAFNTIRNEVNQMASAMIHSVKGNNLEICQHNGEVWITPEEDTDTGAGGGGGAVELDLTKVTSEDFTRVKSIDSLTVVSSTTLRLSYTKVTQRVWYSVDNIVVDIEELSPTTVTVDLVGTTC